ncbi:MAG: SUMF1/EgtB/PvdO family nonheme iron enzyme [Polyangiaceae bacterium]
MLSLAALLGCALATIACDDSKSKDGSKAPLQVSSAGGRGEPGATAASQSSVGATGSAPSASATPSGSSSAAASGPSEPNACPDGMIRVPGGEFWVGSHKGSGSEEEWPRFKTRVQPFCLDKTEVTVDAYEACVKADKCTQASNKHRFCNLRWEGRGKHPINCVDWNQATAYCKAQDARLPTEVEWEFAARGGEEYRAYSWGSEDPDGRTCWKHPGGSCEVGQYAAGAFGLLDMTGNVWEWTSTSFGPYPWPATNNLSKVYRGGSWSRRFNKWMRTPLRNRFPPKSQGSHLGMRCAATPSDVSCPAGKADDGSCLREVLEIDCPPTEKWNGLRCAKQGAPPCPEGRKEKKGFGCVLEHEADGPPPEVESGPVSRSRTAGFDSDCDAHYPGRPHAYRYTGGTHAKRNAVSGGAGCKNRDVGVGWNSCCCP